MKLSVIVCTRNRAHQIIPCLDSIAASLAHASPVVAEIVVVDNGSRDNTAALVEAWALSSAFPVNLLMEPVTGASRARNCGLHGARGDLIIWTDDDCRMDVNYINDALRHAAADTELVFRGGRVELGDPTDLPLSIKTDNTIQRWHRKRYPHKAFKLGTAFIGANMMMPRSLVDRLGFFDTRFGPGSNLPGGEEADYIFRAYLAGVTIEYVPDMIIFHHHGRKTLAIGNKLSRGYVIARGGLYAKYLFKHLDFSRPGYWTIKNAIHETLAGIKHNPEEIGYSNKMVLAYNLLGAMRYWIASAKNLVAGKAA